MPKASLAFRTSDVHDCLACRTDQRTYRQYSSASYNVSANADRQVGSARARKQSVSHSSCLFISRTVSDCPHAARSLFAKAFDCIPRSAVKTYTENEKRAVESSGDPNERQKRHHRRRRPQSKSIDGQPGGHVNRPKSGHSLSGSSSDDEQNTFQVSERLSVVG